MRRLRLGLLLLIGLLVTGTVGTLWFGLTAPYAAKLEAQSNASLSAHVKQTAQPPVPVPELAELERVCRKPLQRALFDPPAPAPVVATALPPPRVRLLGTIIERGRSLAVLAGPQGQTELRSAGQFLSNTGNTVAVVEVSRDQVVLRHLDREIIVPLEEPARPTLVGRR